MVPDVVTLPDKLPPGVGQSLAKTGADTTAPLTDHATLLFLPLCFGCPCVGRACDVKCPSVFVLLPVEGPLKPVTAVPGLTDWAELEKFNAREGVPGLLLDCVFDCSVCNPIDGVVESDCFSTTPKSALSLIPLPLCPLNCMEFPKVEEPGPDPEPGPDFSNPALYRPVPPGPGPGPDLTRPVSNPEPCKAVTLIGLPPLQLPSNEIPPTLFSRSSSELERLLAFPSML